MSALPPFSKADALASVEKIHSRSLGAHLWSWRYIVLRRVSQFGFLLLFFGTAHWGWQVAKDVPLLSGNLSASKFIGLIPLTDPFAALQILLTGHVLQQEGLIGAAIVLGVYL